jgi:hypothetical protein
MKTKGLESSQDLIGGTADHTRAIEILHAHEPAAPVAARIGIAADRSDQGSEVEFAGGRGREAPYIMANDSGRRGRRTAARAARAAPAPRC